MVPTVNLIHDEGYGAALDIQRGPKAEPRRDVGAGLPVKIGQAARLQDSAIAHASIRANAITQADRAGVVTAQLLWNVRVVQLSGGLAGIGRVIARSRAGTCSAAACPSPSAARSDAATLSGTIAQRCALIWYGAITGDGGSGLKGQRDRGRRWSRWRFEVDGTRHGGRAAARGRTPARMQLLRVVRWYAAGRQDRLQCGMCCCRRRRERQAEHKRQASARHDDQSGQRGQGSVL